LLWLDAAIAVIGDLTGVFRLIESDGVLLLGNEHEHNDRWTSDECAAVMQATDEELRAPQLDASIIGYHVAGEWQKPFDEWLAFSTRRSAFVGARGHHRHDQTVLSILAARHGMPISEQRTFSSRDDRETARRAGALFLAHRRRYRDPRIEPEGVLLRAALRILRVEGAWRDTVAHARQRRNELLRRVRKRGRRAAEGLRQGSTHTRRTSGGARAC
jgi:hypothetical protein